MKNFQAYPISPAALIGPILGMGEVFSLGKMQFMSDTANTAGQMGSFDFPALGMVQAMTNDINFDFIAPTFGLYCGHGGKINWLVMGTKLYDGDDFMDIIEVPVIARVTGIISGFDPGAFGKGKMQKGVLSINMTRVEVLEGGVAIVTWGLGSGEFVMGGKDFNALTRLFLAG